jgi:phospholipid/cholesterol/gamma-HCH transport system substrate-binding protein
MRSHWGETAMGFLVLALAAAFLIWSLAVAQTGRLAGGYEVSARFGDVGGLQPGAKVSLAGVKVGSVSAVRVDPKTFLAVVELSLNGDVHIPSDSTAKVTSDGLLGGAHIALTPGGAEDDLKPGGEISNTQGSVDLFGLIGQVIRPHAADPAPAAANAASGIDSGAGAAASGY